MREKQRVPASAEAELRRLYCDEQRSQVEVARHLRVTKDAVREKLQELGIHVRDVGEQTRINVRRPASLQARRVMPRNGAFSPINAVLRKMRSFGYDADQGSAYGVSLGVYQAVGVKAGVTARFTFRFNERQQILSWTKEAVS